MDNLKRIKELLEAFYNGKTSLEEEDELSVLMQATELPEDMKADKELFTSFAMAKEPVDIPSDLNDSIIDLIDRQDKQDRRSKRINLYSISGLAAGLLLILSVYLGFVRDNTINNISQYAIEDPQRAYEETKKALELISDKWNGGTSELRSLSEVQQGLRKSVQPMQKLNSGSKELNLLGNLRKVENIKLQ